jgi:hypothetical protein
MGINPSIIAQKNAIIASHHITGAASARKWSALLLPFCSWPERLVVEVLEVNLQRLPRPVVFLSYGRAPGSCAAALSRFAGSANENEKPPIG